MARARKKYSSDLQDSEWRIIRRLIPIHMGAGRKWQGVYYHYYRWMKSGCWQRINAALVRLARQKGGRSPHPTAGVMDSQSVKTTALVRARGFDGFKRIKGTNDRSLRIQKAIYWKW